MLDRQYCSSGDPSTRAQARRDAVHHSLVAEKEQDQRADEGRKAVFKIPSTAYMAIALLTVCVTPIALGEINGLQWLYIFPIALLSRRAHAHRRDAPGPGRADGVRQARPPWSSLKGLAITGRARVRAVLGDDTQVTLPTVRTRHLPVLALVSKGKSRDPSGVLSDEELKPAAEKAAAKPAEKAPEQTPEATSAETGGSKAEPPAE